MTIPLLKPDEVKTGPSRAAGERRAIVRDLAEEETRLTISVNNLRADFEEAQKVHDANIQKMRNEAATERVELELDIKRLKDERAPLLEPVEKLQKEAENRNQQSLEREQAVSKRESDADARSTAQDDRDERLTERQEAIADKEQEIAERDEESKKRDENSKRVAEQAAESLKEVNGKWAIYHEATVRQNHGFEEREARVAAGEKANIDRAATLDKRDAAQSAEALRLESERTAIEQAAKHLGLKP